MALSSDIGALLKIVPQYVQGRKQQKEGRIKEAQGQVYMDFANQQRDKAIEQNQEYFNKALDQMQGFNAAYQSQLGEQKGIYGTQLAMANQLASQGIPDAVKKQMIEGSQRAASSQLASAESARGSLGAAARSQQTMSDAYGQMGAMDAQQMLQNKQSQIAAQGQYANQLKQLSNAELAANQQLNNFELQGMQQFYTNPQFETAYMNMGKGQNLMDYGAALQGSGMNNVYGSFGSAGDYMIQKGNQQDQMIMQGVGMMIGMPPTGAPKSAPAGNPNIIPQQSQFNPPSQFAPQQQGLVGTGYFGGNTFGQKIGGYDRSNYRLGI